MTDKTEIMPDINQLFKTRGKHIFLTVIISATAVGVITFLKPRQYLSTATAVPASSVTSDKSKIFSENIEALYSALGNPDDLDLVTGTAKLDTVYLFVTDKFNLFDHYKIKKIAARDEAASLLKKNTRVIKSEYGELKVKVWDTDKELAPQLANAIMDKLQSIHTGLHNNSNEIILQSLKKRKKELEQITDTIKQSSELNNSIAVQIARYEKYISEYQLMADMKPPALIIVENAKPARWADRPRKAGTIAATVFISFLFAVLTALILDRKKIG